MNFKRPKHHTSLILKALLFSLCATLFTPVSSLAGELVATDFNTTDEDTQYICQESAFDSDRAFQLFKRNTSEDVSIENLWLLADFYPELALNISLRKRWKKTLARRVRNSNVRGKKVRNARKKFRLFRRTVNELRECQPNFLQNTDPCQEVAEGLVTRSQGDTHLRIINGLECTQGDSSVVRLRIGQGLSTSSCSGTVIAPHTVLTAAHCLERGPNRVQVVSGNGSIEANGYIIHPRYDGRAFINLEAYDIALVFTSTPLPTAISSVVNGFVAANEQAIIAGFGLDENDEHGRLKAAQIFITGIDFNTIRTRFDKTVHTTNTCFGDSGGPLFVNRNGRWVIAGITSNGDSNNCGVTSGRDVSRYSNLSNPLAYNFIVDNLS